MAFIAWESSDKDGDIKSKSPQDRPTVEGASTPLTVAYRSKPTPRETQTPTRSMKSGESQNN